MNDANNDRFLDAIAGRVQAHLDAGAAHVALQSIGATLEDSLA